MKTTFEKVLRVFRVILYVILLPWPLYVVLPILFIGPGIQPLITLFVFALEIVLGIFLTTKQFNKQKETKKIGSRIYFGVLLLSLLVYSITAIFYLIKVSSIS
jgi:hypothetical protein